MAKKKSTQTPKSPATLPLENLELLEKKNSLEGEDKPGPQLLPTEYLDLSTNQLLGKFGEGSHIPGSGSAAALSGLLAVELMITVCKLTISKSTCERYHKDFKFIQRALENEYRVKLRELFVADINSFDKVSKLRTARKLAQDPKEKSKLTRAIGIELEESILIPLEICTLSLRLIDYSFSIFDNGFQSAQGDSGVAISNLLSAISGALFVAFINLKYGKDYRWSIGLRSNAERLAMEYHSKHKESLRRVLNLYMAGLSEGGDQVKINFG